ncbi:MAG: ABC transporter permease subunit, partial [Pseudomonadota bacterium]
MLRFLLRRLLFTALTFFVIVSAVFFLLRAAPGGPFDGERHITPEIEANLLAAYDMDAPLWVQYGRYLSKLLQADLGPSFKQKDFTVNELIAAGLPVSAALGASALCLALLLGMLLGTLAGFNQGSRLDTWIMSMNNINLALPGIVTAPLLVLAFAVILGWLPAAGSGTFSHFILPSIALGLPLSAQIARMMRGGVAATLNEPFLRTARAKGISELRLVVRHVLPSAVIPLISFMAPAAAALLTGSVVVEQVFDLPGIGR